MQKPFYRSISSLLALYPSGMVALVLIALLSPQRVGMAALAQVFAPYLFLPLIALIPFALRKSAFLLRISLLAACATFVIVYPPALNLVQPANTQERQQIRALTWNVYVNGVEPAQLKEAIATHEPTVIALQEVDPDMVADDPDLQALFPYQVTQPDEIAPNMVILSRYPIIATGVPLFEGEHWDMPRLMWAKIDLNGQPITVVSAHPIPPRTSGDDCPLLSCYNSGPRDAQIADIQRFVAEFQQQNPGPLLLIGDMNVTEREQAYFDLSHGLTDAQRSAGVGFGTSWRPGVIKLPLALLRIDYMFSNAQLTPRSLETDCTWRGSDHCLLAGQFELSANSFAYHQP